MVIANHGAKPCPPPLLRTDTPARDRRTVTGTQRPSQGLEEEQGLSGHTPSQPCAHALHTHTHTPPTAPERGSTAATPRDTVPRRIKTPIQAGEEGRHQNRTAKKSQHRRGRAGTEADRPTFGSWCSHFLAGCLGPNHIPSPNWHFTICEMDISKAPGSRGHPLLSTGHG